MKKLAVIFLTIVSVGLCGCVAKDNKATSADLQELHNKNIMQEKVVRISCAGDCTLGTDVSFGGSTLPVEVEAQNNDYGWFLRNVEPIFSEDDLTIVNFEGTLTDRGLRQDKTFAFRGSPEYVNILTEGSVEAVTLANNHSVDYGEVSMADTKTYLDEAGIIWFENLNAAVVEKNGVKIGLIGLNALSGTAEANLPKAMDKVKNDGAELVIVQIHWGIEGDLIPMASQRQLAHTAIDLGAELVIGHHPHVVQGLEKYNGRMIVYSLGNFCFGGNQNPKDKDAMIFQQTFTMQDGKALLDDNWRVYPCSISSVRERNNYQPTVATGDEGIRIRKKIQKITDAIGGPSVKFAIDVVETAN